MSLKFDDVQSYFYNLGLTREEFEGLSFDDKLTVAWGFGYNAEADTDAEIVAVTNRGKLNQRMGHTQRRRSCDSIANMRLSIELELCFTDNP